MRLCSYKIIINGLIMKWTNAAFVYALLASVTLTGCSDIETYLSTTKPSEETISNQTDPLLTCEKCRPTSEKPTIAPLEVLTTSTPLPTARMTPTISVPGTSQKPCEGSFVNPRTGYMDGAGGFLWKNGDTTKKIAVIISGKYRKPESVVVYGTRGASEALNYAGTGNPDKDGLRWHYRGSKPTGSYEGKVDVFTADKKCTYTFKNVSRVD